MKFIIRFKDGDMIHTYRNNDGHGTDKEFDTMDKAQEFLNELDSREFERWIEVKE